MSQPETNKHRRKVLLINPQFQLRVLGFFGGISMVTILAFFAAVRYFFVSFANRGREIGLPPGHVFFAFIQDQQRSMDIIFVAIAFVVLGFLAVSGLILSHRVAGPIHRLKKHLEEVASGKDVKDVRFRKGDFFPELAELTNQALAQRPKSRHKDPAA